MIMGLFLELEKFQDQKKMGQVIKFVADFIQRSVLEVKKGVYVRLDMKVLKKHKRNRSCFVSQSIWMEQSIGKAQHNCDWLVELFRKTKWITYTFFVKILTSINQKQLLGQKSPCLVRQLKN